MSRIHASLLVVHAAVCSPLSVRIADHALQSCLQRSRGAPVTETLAADNIDEGGGRCGDYDAFWRVLFERRGYRERSQGHHYWRVSSISAVTGDYKREGCDGWKTELPVLCVDEAPRREPVLD